MVTKFGLSRQIPALLSAYRQTSFTMQDGISEWKGDGKLCIAEYDSKLAGILRLDSKRNYWALSSFVVSSEFRGLGIGQNMLGSLNLDKPVYLKVKQDNPAINLYLRNNYKTLETLDGRHIMKKWNY